MRKCKLLTGGSKALLPRWTQDDTSIDSNTQARRTGRRRDGVLLEGTRRRKRIPEWMIESKMVLDKANLRCQAVRLRWRHVIALTAMSAPIR